MRRVARRVTIKTKRWKITVIEHPDGTEEVVLEPI